MSPMSPATGAGGSLDRYSEALAEVVLAARRDDLSTSRICLPQTARFLDWKNDSGHMLLNRPCRLPEIETWATGANVAAGGAHLRLRVRPKLMGAILWPPDVLR